MPTGVDPDRCRGDTPADCGEGRANYLSDVPGARQLTSAPNESEARPVRPLQVSRPAWTLVSYQASVTGSATSAGRIMTSSMNWSASKSARLVMLDGVAAPDVVPPVSTVLLKPAD